jgi:hypothetical protein
LQNKAVFEPELVNTAEYLNTKYKEEMFVNIDENNESYEPNMI